MLQQFCKDIQPGEVIAVEAPFRLRKLDPENEKMLKIPVVGILDLVEQDQGGRIVVVDHKTVARKYQYSKVEQDLQMSIYSAALKRSRIVNGAPKVHCRFDVLLKTKQPELVQYYTVRNDDHRRRMFKVVNEIILAIDCGIFYPNIGWQCSSQFKSACDRWLV